MNLINYEFKGAVLILYFPGVAKINILSSSELEKEILKITGGSDAKEINFDLSNIKYIDSTGFSLLKSFAAKMAINEIKFHVTNENEELAELFKLVDLDYLIIKKCLTIKKFNL